MQARFGGWAAKINLQRSEELGCDIDKPDLSHGGSDQLPEQRYYLLGKYRASISVRVAAELDRVLFPIVALKQLWAGTAAQGPDVLLRHDMRANHGAGGGYQGAPVRILLLAAG